MSEYKRRTGVCVLIKHACNKLGISGEVNEYIER